MTSNCPHCQSKFSQNHRQKIDTAVASLGPGKTLKFSCPVCQESIEIAGATSGTPDFGTGAPQPPSLTWLRTGTIADKEVLDDFSLVMILIPNAHPAKNTVATVFEGLGYKPVFPESATDAIQRMRFTEYSAVVLHSHYEGTLADSTFHRHMNELSMEKRRAMYYVLLGPEFHTLYNLEALSHSVNIVVNDNELPELPVILKKSFREYDELFSPYMSALREQGKR